MINTAGHPDTATRENFFQPHPNGAVRVAVAAVLEVAHVVDNPPWMLKASPKEFEALVRDCVEKGLFTLLPASRIIEDLYKHADAVGLPDEERAKRSDFIHASRIAYLMAHPDTTPLEIDVGIPGHTDPYAWAVDDGNHRLYAAAMREDTYIWANLSGSTQAICDIFGDDCVM